MRVLYLSAEAELGGAERSLLDILASMRRAQPSWPLHLVVAADGPLVREATALGVSTLVLPFDRAVARLGESGAAADGGFAELAVKTAWAALPAAAYVMRLRRVIRTIGPDIVHTNNVKMHLLGAWARFSNAALVWHLHEFVRSRRFTASLLGVSVRRVSAVVANSDSVAEDARAALGTHVPIVMVHNGVDLERFSGAGDRVDLDRVSGLPPAAPGVVRVGLVATFGRWKGHTTFLDAMASLPADVPVRGYVIGGAVYRTDNSQYRLTISGATRRSAASPIVSGSRDLSIVRRTHFGRWTSWCTRAHRPNHSDWSSPRPWRAAAP